MFRRVSFDYGESPVPIRDDLPAAFRRAWQRLASPGTWWTGEERLALAAEARNAVWCPLCEERRHALSPGAVSGEHRGLGALPPPTVDAVHRITTDPGRLSRAWFDGLVPGALGEGAYVELVGVVASLISIDAFHCALGLPLEPLPEPLPGEPSRYRPDGLRGGEAWVAMLGTYGARGAESDLWRGRAAGNVIRALSSVPDELRGLRDLSAVMYLPIEQAVDLGIGRALSRPQIELVAGRVSALNECFY
jgi:hypothetical protein